MNASGRLNTRKSNGNIEKLASLMTSGERVRNTYATYLLQGDSPEKSGLIPHNISNSHVFEIKTPVVKDGHAAH